MADDLEPMRINAPTSFRRSLSRRALLQWGTAAAGVAIVGCGSSSKASPATTGAAATTGAPTTAAATTSTGAPTTTAAATTTGAATTAPGTTAAASTSAASGDLLSEFSDVTNKATGKLAMYTWGDYNDPELVGKLAESTLGVSMQVDYYTSNEDLITKLETAKGTAGFDIVVPTGPYITQMIQKGLLQKLDKSKLPNIVNIDPIYLGKDWDPGNDYSVCKDWGSTGYIWDTSKIKADIKTWNDFIAAAQGEASGQTSVLDTAANVCGMYFWANGIDWNTEKAEDLDAAEKFLVEQFAQHLKAFDSYPSTKIAEGAYTLSMAWNGDARQAYQRIADAGGDPSVWKWALGAPDTELWMDNYAVPVGAPNPDASHAWINWDLSPKISIQDLAYHGYNTGMKKIDKLLELLNPKLPKPEMIFFADAQVKTMHTQKITSAQDRLQAILDKIKAKAGG
jgi:spermidine/putrescine transport system substrate-binding protein